jgi:hypothetical protein
MRLPALLASVLVLFTLQSCMLCSRMDKLVSQHYARKQALKPIEEKANVSINTTALNKVNGFCRSRYKRFFTIPLLIYTYSDERIQCDVNPKIYAGLIVRELYSKMETEEWRGKLDGKILYLNFGSIPSRFTHNYENHFIALPIFYTSINLSYTKEEGFSERKGMYLSYTIKDNSGNILKQGELEQTVNNTYIKRPWSQWRKHFIQDFISNFDGNFEEACRALSDKLLNVL